MLELPLIFLIVVTLSHGGVLLFARRHQEDLPEKREKWWRLHFWVHGTLWIVSFSGLIFIQWYLPRGIYPWWVQAFGFLSMALGVFLVIRARLLLGHKQAMGIRFFFPEKMKRINTSLYKYLNNPMYDGFILILTGLGLLFGIVVDFYLAGGSFLLFNIFLASIENYGWRWNPF
jgi:protein-S-isoprenylcysteine O-methyltransferase Ste14